MPDRATDVTIACDAELTGDVLRVRFELTNGGAEVVHVFDDRGRSGKADVLCDGGDGAVRLLVGVPPLPPFPVYWQFHPKTTALAPGASLRGEVAAPVPLREAGAYYRAAYEPSAAVEVARVWLRVDLLRASRVTSGDHPEPRGAIECAVAEAALPRPVALLRRADAFDRV
jgi:hypothetical protein